MKKYKVSYKYIDTNDKNIGGGNYEFQTNDYLSTLEDTEYISNDLMDDDNLPDGTSIEIRFILLE